MYCLSSAGVPSFILAFLNQLQRLESADIDSHSKIQQLPHVWVLFASITIRIGTEMSMTTKQSACFFSLHFCILTVLLLSVCCNASAAESWNRLQAPAFGMVSQLNEKDTLRRATEFNQFIGSLRQLFPIDDALLPPLTIVLFSRERDFAPYRNQTASGQSKNVAGIFANAEDWSVIGMYGQKSSDETRRVIYHEATHWYLSAKQVESPLWFSEGIAEVFSTFNVKDDKAQWGLALGEHVSYLNTVGLQPLHEFLRVTQDEALHEVDTFYPQAWAFVHYLMFGDGGSHRVQLDEFLRQLQKVSIDTAFQTAFGKSYEDMDKDLRSYLRSGGYVYAQVPLQTSDDALELAPATATSVEFALARLAVVGGNGEIALGHAQKVVNALPSRPEGYEILAHVESFLNDSAGTEAALNKAIELQSRDAQVYALKAENMLNANWQTTVASPDEALSPAIARQVADYYSQSLHIRRNNKTAMRGYVTALLNSREVNELDAPLLQQLAVVFPNDGTPIFGDAIIAHINKDPQTSNTLLATANIEPRRLPVSMRNMARSVRQRWYHEWIRATLDPMLRAGSYEEARAWLDEKANDASLDDQQHEALAEYQSDVTGFESIRAAQRLAGSGQLEEAKSRIEAILNDSNISGTIKLAARQLRSRLNRAP
jgi:hypothetical protein